MSLAFGYFLCPSDRCCQDVKKLEYFTLASTDAFDSNGVWSRTPPLWRQRAAYVNMILVRLEPAKTTGGSGGSGGSGVACGGWPA
eukprot:6057671-Pleurochrysis_carterae.AAC.1